MRATSVLTRAAVTIGGSLGSGLALAQPAGTADTAADPGAGRGFNSLSAPAPAYLPGPDGGVLATIFSQDPIYVTFPVVVEDGLSEGERVIVESIRNIRPGMAVAIGEAEPARPARQTALQPKVPGRIKTQAQFAFGTGKVLRFEGESLRGYP